MMLPFMPGVRLVIRHGILSDSLAMTKLKDALMGDFGLTLDEVDSRTYDWEATILRNGVELAAGLVAAPASDGVALVGHSMGGLVCRIANCALTDANFLNIVEEHKAEFRASDIKPVLNAKLGLHRVGSIVTLATPNSGAMTHSQVSMFAHLLYTGLKMVGKPVWVGSEGIADLRTDRIFRILQHCRTPTPCLTVSGSWGNRLLRGVKGGAYRTLSPWIANMREPHDQIVEDESVDLGRSILPHEFIDPPEHHRAYIDCTYVTHINIHERPKVHEMVTNFIGLHP